MQKETNDFIKYIHFEMELLYVVQVFMQTEKSFKLFTPLQLFLNITARRGL